MSPRGKGLTDAVAEMAKKDPQAAREMIVERGMDAFADGLVDALKPKKECQVCGQSRYNTWAHRLFARIAKLVDATPQIMIAFLDRFGVRSEQELGQLIESGRRIERAQSGKTSPEEYVDAAVDILRWAFRDSPALKQQVMRRLSSEATVGDGDGEEA